MFFFSDELPPLREERAPSPPPAYDEVTKSQKPTEQTDGISTSDVKIDMGNESPPEYAAAIAMSATQNATQVNNQLIRYLHQFRIPIYEFFKLVAESNNLSNENINTGVSVFFRTKHELK